MGRDSPICSEFEDDPAIRERIDEFVVGIGERVDALQDSHTTGDPRHLAELVRSLAAQAGELGFAPLAESARRVAEHCENRDLKQAEEELLALTEISVRIRLGHRGAA